MPPLRVTRATLSRPKELMRNWRWLCLHGDSDQLKAIRDVEKTWKGRVPMDHLWWGMLGLGKTECDHMEGSGKGRLWR
jgi:hypothetical protein